MSENSLAENYPNSKEILFTQINPCKLAYTSKPKSIDINKSVEEGRFDVGLGRVELSSSQLLS